MRALWSILVFVGACAGNQAAEPAPGTYGASCRADCECISHCCFDDPARGSICEECGRPPQLCTPGEACGAIDVPGVGSCDPRGCCIIDGQIASLPTIDAQVDAQIDAQ